MSYTKLGEESFNTAYAQISNIVIFGDKVKDNSSLIAYVGPKNKPKVNPYIFQLKNNQVLGHCWEFDYKARKGFLRMTISQRSFFNPKDIGFVDLSLKKFIPNSVSTKHCTLKNSEGVEVGTVDVTLRLVESCASPFWAEMAEIYV